MKNAIDKRGAVIDMKKTITLIVLLVSSLTVGQAQPKKLKMHKDAEAMKQEIAKQIPIGSRITDAQTNLAANGFKCALKEQKSFLETKEDKSIAEHNNLNFLFCEKSESGLSGTHLWQVAVVYQQGIVSDILNSVAEAPVLSKKDYINMSDAEIRNILLKYAPLGSSEDEVKKVLRQVFHRGYEKNTDYSEKNPCYTCPKEKGGFTFRANMQNYDWLRNFFLAGNFVLSVWYFDKKGVLTEVAVSHEWDGV